MASEQTVAENSSSSQVNSQEKNEVIEKANELLAQGKRSVVCNDFQKACTFFEEATKLLATECGDLSYKVAAAYFSYGCALLEVGRQENGVLGNALQGVPVEEEAENEESEQFEKPPADESEERMKVRAEVYEAMAEEEREKKDAEKAGEKESKESDPVEKQSDKEDVKEKSENEEKCKSESDSKGEKTSELKGDMETDGSDAKENGAKVKNSETKNAEKPEDMEQTEDNEKKNQKAEEAKEISNTVKESDSKDSGLTDSEAKTETLEKDTNGSTNTETKTEPEDGSKNTDTKKAEENGSKDTETKKPEKDCTKDTETKNEPEKDGSKNTDSKTADNKGADKSENESKEESMEIKEKSESDKNNSEASNSEDKTKDDQKESNSEGATEKPDETENKTEENMDYDDDEETAEGEESQDEEETVEDGGSQDESQIADDLPTFQSSWEYLELAKVIYLKCDNKNDQLKAADCYLKLGELGMELETYKTAVEDMEKALDIQKKHVPADDRLLAETHYQLGLCYGAGSDFENSVKHLKSAVDVIESKIASLNKLLEEQEKDSDDKENKENDQFMKYKKEIKDLQDLLPEMKAKVEDTLSEKEENDKLIKEKAKEIAKIAFGSPTKKAETNGCGASGDQVDENNEVKPKDITSLVRKKRKPEDEAAATTPVEVKKIRKSTEVSASEVNGDAQKNGHKDRNGEAENPPTKDQEKPEAMAM